MDKKFTASEYTKRVYDRMEKMAQGELISWDELTRVLGLDAQSDAGRGYIATARKNLRRRKRFVIEAVVGEGMRRLTDVEITTHGRKSRKRINRMARRESDKIDCLDRKANLTDDQRREHQAHQLMIGYLIQESTYEKQKKVENVIRNNGIPPQQDLNNWKAF